MGESKIVWVLDKNERRLQLEQELRRSQMAYLEAEAKLAEEQAAVNAFRMHCRLKLDDLVDLLQDLNAQKQGYVTKIAFLRQGMDLSWLEDGDIFDEEIEEKTYAEYEQAQDIILPTPVPRDKAAEKRLYRELARRFHPDLARTAVEQSYRTMMMTAVNEAYAANNLSMLYDLAGELDPEEINELTGIEDAEIRELRKKIIQFERQCRRAIQKLNLLREENTARLWRRAQIIGEEGRDWWSLVQDELKQTVAKRQAEIEDLQLQLQSLNQQRVMSEF